MPKLSVIIPAYNVEKYIDRCINSIINQTFTDLEIIIIDDGSTDDTGKICNEWVLKDSRIKVYHKANGGLSDARNYGIEKSTGEYIGFVDSDDWINPNMYQNLINGCEKNNKDIGCCNKIFVYGNKEKTEILIDSNKCLDRFKTMEHLLLTDPSVCNKIFRKEKFTNIKFPFGKLYEDLATTPYLIDKSNGAYFDTINGYYYLQTNKRSITHSDFNTKKMDLYYHLLDLKKFIYSRYPELMEQMNSKCALYLSDLLIYVYKHKRIYPVEYQNIVNEIRKTCYMKNQFIPFYKKIMIFCNLHKMAWFTNLMKFLFK